MQLVPLMTLENLAPFAKSYARSLSLRDVTLPATPMAYKRDFLNVLFRRVGPG
jgi:hypothetical protein